MHILKLNNHLTPQQQEVISSAKILIVCTQYLYCKMSDPEKLKNYDEEPHSLDSTGSDTSKKSESVGITGFKEKIVGKITGATDSKMDGSDVSLSESIRISNNIRMILLGLFALIGFIILVFAIFTASVSVELAQIATSVFMAAFIAAIVGAFTLFGVVVYQIRGEYRTRQ